MAESIRVECGICAEKLDIDISDGHAVGPCSWCGEPIQVQPDENGRLIVFTGESGAYPPPTYHIEEA